MSHDFEPTDAEKEMLSYMKDIEVNQKPTELGEIISGAILDGQNQIHDLYKEKATAQQIEYRMRRAYVYWMDRLNKANDHQLQKAREEERERIKGLLQGWEASERTNFDSDEEYQLHIQKVGAINWYTRLVHGWIDDADHSELDQPTV